MSSDQPLAAGHAPGKIILLGEHAVVYGRPAIAVPLTDVGAHAFIYPDQRCLVEALDLNHITDVAAASTDDPFAAIVRLVCAELGQPLPSWRIVVHADIPIASGLGSGAAIATAIARALVAGFGADLDAAQLSGLVYEVERIHHGTPSGIDNTVVVYAQPVWFVRDQPPQPFRVATPVHLLVADTGIASPTRLTVGAVRRGWERDRRVMNDFSTALRRWPFSARLCIETGQLTALGGLMNENQSVLASMSVSSPELDRLCASALSAGALGAKLSGGGKGGNMIALVTPGAEEGVASRLLAAGATRVLGAIIRGD